jgi:hypothetical protein
LLLPQQGHHLGDSPGTIVSAQASIGTRTVWFAALLAQELFGSAAAIIAATITAF